MGGFATVVARAAKASLTPSLAARATDGPEEITDDTQDAINGKESSGLTPIEVGITLAVFVGMFVVLVCIGELLKIYNKPSTEAAPYMTLSRQLYQPSAAGYGTRGQKQQQQHPSSSLAVPSNQKVGSRTSLLESASPMGTGGRGIDDSFGDSTMTTPSSHGHGGAGDYFSRGDYATNGMGPGSSRGHARGQSSGISLPGPAAAARRGGGGGGEQHPRLNGASPIGPDGGGFRPGQVFNYASMAPGAGPSGAPVNGGYRGPGAKPQLRQHPIGRGPPPAQDGNRRSRYARSRIDSVGPGVLRKSMYMSGDDDPRSTSGEGGSNLRRVDSIGKGDPRRKSQAYGLGAGGPSSPPKGGRVPSIYNNGHAEKATLLSAQADNFGAGRTDPLSARRGPSPNPGPRGGNDPRGGGNYNMSPSPVGSGPSRPYPSPSPGAYQARGPPPPHMQSGYPGPRAGPPQAYGRPQMMAGGGQRQII
ncbi:hypothetical protein FA10DRAFT_266555 [Acaromyces ingoldii]|uniref:Uncharacterized protein n=1 Tax=Acaromyces ingoldii TaxID=215250 RepID=A0A316YMZ7_9BASI|nr:hypothetical protein FA10DRAFT_266555 [Acaromyces ingoldii]PWN90038.1 hypothetical protein FA10DRAFT_266555 [Acaromyces ingoldii]